jgi:hypothetical protein
MKLSHVSLILALVSVLATAAPVRASVSGRRNTALGATGLALYELATGHTGTGLLAAAGAGYAWNQYSKSHRRHNRRDAFYEGYRQGVRRSYHHWHRRR